MMSLTKMKQGLSQNTNNMLLMTGYERHAYRQKDTLLHPMNPLQEKLFDIEMDEILLMSYNIRKAWLQSASLYVQRAEARDRLARGSENAFLLRHTSGRPPGANLF
jgi:hypothetical protein